MESNIELRHLRINSPIFELISYLTDNESTLNLEESRLYYDFPILKDLEDEVVIAQAVLISRHHGIIIFITSNATHNSSTSDELHTADQQLDHIFSLIYSRLIRNRSLRLSKTELVCPITNIIYAPSLNQKPNITLESQLVLNNNQLGNFFSNLHVDNFDIINYNELTSTFEGAKGLLRPRLRDTTNLAPQSKGVIANKAESEITSFDRQQKLGAMCVPDGLQRIRGLAGSGKTVVLALKAALTHLKDDKATICYTFYTKSLYQHIQRLITRFYRQFDDRDPDWSRVQILHAWGGYNVEGVYFNACIANNVAPFKLSEVRSGEGNPFDYACQQLLHSTRIKPMYDYMFIDEGQDFPASFMQLALKLTSNYKVAFAYDDLQTIFQATTPDLKDIVGVDKNGNSLIDLTVDTVLNKCYRNPREILVCAHALGFGIYGRPVQMLENEEQWVDIGYRVIEGNFKAGSATTILRPPENSLTAISSSQKPEEIVKAFVYSSFDEEVTETVSSIKKDLSEGLRPDDILVIAVDDRHAKNYLKSISESLAKIDIQSNNIHDGSYGIRDFYREGHITLSTVHKAKGNEAFMVYVIGVDALNSLSAGVRERNVLFTAMTRGCYQL
jgi:superfamily I DNA and RNA helicase